MRIRLTTTPMGLNTNIMDSSRPTPMGAALTTKKPGWYLNGRTFRPSHIHVKIYLGDTERLTTQLYFEGDPFIADDRWASEAPQRAVQLTRSDNGTLSGVFDFTVG